MGKQGRTMDADDGMADTRDKRGDVYERTQTPSHQRSRIRVLYVDDAPDLVEMNREHLKQYDDRIALEVARSASDGMDRLANETVDCIVSDYAMPGPNGIEFCENIRDAHTTLPFILYTSRPCETIATEALSAGVTDYVQKERGTDHLAVLANKIVTAVESRRSRRTRNRLFDVVETLEDGIGLLDEDGRFTYVDDAYADNVGTEPNALIGEHLAHVYEDVPKRDAQQLHDVDEIDNSMTTLQPSRDIAGEHLLVKTAHDGLVCAIRHDTS